MPTVARQPASNIRKFACDGSAIRNRRHARRSFTYMFAAKAPFFLSTRALPGDGDSADQTAGPGGAIIFTFLPINTAVGELLRVAPRKPRGAT